MRHIQRLAFVSFSETTELHTLVKINEPPTVSPFCTPGVPLNRSIDDIRDFAISYVCVVRLQDADQLPAETRC
jgi:hypothetical protein